MKIKIIFVIVAAALLLGLGIGAVTSAKITSKIVSKSKDREYDGTIKVWKYVYDKQSAGYDSLARISKITIQNKFDKVKNRKGNMYFIPSSTIQIEKAIEKYKVRTDTLKIIQ
jgi:hypothetical protein